MHSNEVDSSSFQRIQFLFWGCDKIEQEHELEIIEEGYKATRHKIAQFTLIKWLIRPISGEDTKGRRDDEALKPEIGMRLRVMATAVVPTAFDS